LVILAERSSSRYYRGKDLIPGSKSAIGRFTSRVVEIQSAAMTSVGLRNAVATNNTGTLVDVRRVTVTDLSETAIAEMRSGLEMRISGHGGVATK